MTNADWVRSLPNDELAEFIYHFEFDSGCCQFTNRFNEKKISQVVAQRIAVNAY